MRSREGMAVPMVSSAGRIIFGGFQRFVASFRVVGVALCDIQTRSVTCRKSFCVASAILLRRFQKMRGSFPQFFVPGAALWTCPSSFFVADAALWTCRVGCFFANRMGRAASSGDKVQIPWHAWHFVRCTEN